MAESLALMIKEMVEQYLSFRERRKASAEESLKLKIKEAQIGIRARRNWRRWLLEFLDDYGESNTEAEYRPGAFPKSSAGACCSIFFAIVFWFLVAWSIWRLVTRNTELVAGDVIAYNSNRLETNGWDVSVSICIRFTPLLRIQFVGVFTHLFLHLALFRPPSASTDCLPSKWRCR